MKEQRALMARLSLIHLSNCFSKQFPSRANENSRVPDVEAWKDCLSSKPKQYERGLRRTLSDAGSRGRPSSKDQIRLGFSLKPNCLGVAVAVLGEGTRGDGAKKRGKFENKAITLGTATGLRNRLEQTDLKSD